MSERLDLSKHPEWVLLDFYSAADAEMVEEYNEMRAEARRAQASEDAEKARADKAEERVRVLKRESLTYLIDSLVGVGNRTDVSDMLRIGLRAIGCSQFAHLSRHEPGGCAEIIAKAIADAENKK